MVTITGPNEGIKHNYPLGTFWKTDNDDTLRLIDEVLHLGVIDKDLAAQPGGPTLGDRYILPAGATGADWAGHDTEVAIFTELDAGNDWEFRVPKLGWLAFVQDESTVYFWNASAWTILTTQAQVSQAVTALAANGTLSMDLATGVRNYETTLDGNATLVFSNIPAASQTEVSVKVVQDGVGGHTLTLPAGGISPNGTPPVRSSGANCERSYLDWSGYWL